MNKKVKPDLNDNLQLARFKQDDGTTGFNLEVTDPLGMTTPHPINHELANALVELHILILHEDGALIPAGTEPMPDRYEVQFRYFENQGWLDDCSASTPAEAKEMAHDAHISTDYPMIRVYDALLDKPLEGEGMSYDKPSGEPA